ncbi:MAG TPA: biosynthetic-type acetolactate synthase large subunit [Polyangiaceae bacterium]
MAAPVTNITPNDSSRETRRLTGSQIIWDTLANQGVDVVFGYPGGAIMPAYDALPQYPSVRHILVRHEQGAAHMADGYARASGRVGVAVATSGPGATNLVTGIANAMMDSIPIVCITGQVPSTLIGSDAFQEVDITGITLPITKHNFLVTRAEDIMPTIRQAFYIASSGRPGPVLVDITKDAQNATVDYRYEGTPVLPGYRPERQPIAQDIEKALEMLKKAKRPIIFCGHGVVKSNATALLLELVQRTNIPVALTLLGLGGFPASHPRSLGMMGMHGEAWVNTAIQEADLIIALGMRFDDRVTGNLKTYAPHAKKIHVELDPAEINKNVKVDLPLLGDLRETLRLLIPHTERLAIDEWVEHIESLKGDSAVRDIREMPDLGRLFAAHVIHDLWRYTEGKALVVTDVGQHQMWEAQYYKHDHPRKLLTSGGAGTMGFALPAAMGARLACPEDEIWVVAGDGGFQMTACELSTCAQEDIKVNVAIINNGYLGMVRQWQQFFYGGRYVATPIKSPDFVKLAEAHDLMGIRVEKREQVRAAVEAARASKKTCIIDFRVEQEDSVYPMVPAGADLHAMIRRPMPERHNPIYETGED